MLSCLNHSLIVVAATENALLIVGAREGVVQTALYLAPGFSSHNVSSPIVRLRNSKIAGPAPNF
jgi:hypothetical protein